MTKAPTGIGMLVFDARMYRGWTQVQLAKEMGTVQSAVSDLERGVIEPNLSTIIKAMKALNFDLTISVQPKENWGTKWKAQ